MGAFDGLSVLLLEDEYLIALDTGQILNDFGFAKVDMVGTLAETAERSAAGQIDVAILDVNINGEMSFPVAQTLRDRGIPVIFATGTRAMVNGANSIAFNLSLTAGAAADDLPLLVGTAQAFGLTTDGAAHAVVLYAMAPAANFVSMPAGTYTSAPITVTVSY